MLWIQRKRRRKIIAESVEDNFEALGSHKANKEDWIKSHFSRLSDEKLEASSHAASASPQLDSGSGEASTRIRVDTFTTRHGEGGSALHRESFTSRQRTSGSSVSKETHKESGKSSSTDEAIWAAVAACTKEIDCKGRQLANSMLQRATACQHTGHLEAKDINPEELKTLEEVELKLKGGFLTQQENTIAGMNQTHTFQGHSPYGHQSHPAHPSHQSHSMPNHSH
ncbi:PREDICTED: uncharacterized protein C10orf62 homolog [Chrysochloris asiatica]|uniref:Uncharacterized protein C10orf62 homolog n=1 Tax=Chrysochloris asiatica TaxID=185453 RepID=A0A9B0SUL1_CHRAS|nr:PREDICTED: uncharacterized protein C10orf62 homolog [Chrysochloris asiatica]